VGLLKLRPTAAASGGLNDDDLFLVSTQKKSKQKGTFQNNKNKTRSLFSKTTTRFRLSAAGADRVGGRATRPGPSFPGPSSVAAARGSDRMSDTDVSAPLRWTDGAKKII